MAYTKHAQWLFEEGARPKGMFEPIYFQKMRGNIGQNQDKIYDFTRTRAYMEEMVRQGVTQVWINWWKGYGLEKEKACQDQAAALFPVIRELGMRAVCYHSFGSLTFDTLLAEEPDAVNWITRTQNGQPTSCQVTFQCFRYRPCFSSDGYLSYMERVLARAIDAGCDGIHFDNIGFQAEPEACHCERCTRLFREYLQETYGGELGEEVFGFSDFSHATVPWFNQHNQPNKLNNAMVAHHRAWIDFKCRVLGNASNRLIDFVHNRNPEVFVEMNACEGEGFPAAFWRGNDCDMLFPKLEMVCDEGNGHYGVNSNGAMIGQHRAKKLCVSFDCAHWGAYNPNAQAIDFSEERAVCYHAPMVFWEKYKEYQLKGRSLAKVAVLRERNSLAYNRWDPWEETLAIEQYLIERHIPFDFVHNAQLTDLPERYEVLICAGMEIMSDEIRDRITAYVADGGSLLLSGAAGKYDEHYRLRQIPVDRIETVADFEQAHQPRNAFFELIGDDPQACKQDVILNEYQKGRVGWIREMDVHRVARTPANWCHSPDNLMLPRNAPQIDALLAGLLPEGIGLDVSTGGKLYVHLAHREDTGEWMLHLINHEFQTKKANARIRLKTEKEPVEIVSVSMDDAEAFEERSESFSMDGSWLCFNMNDIGIHRTAIMRFAK